MSDGMQFIVKTRGLQNGLASVKIHPYDPVERLLCGPNMPSAVMLGVLKMYIAPIMERDSRVEHPFDIEQMEMHHLLFFAADYYRVRSIKEEEAKINKRDFLASPVKVTEDEVYKRFSLRAQSAVLTPALAVQTFSVVRKPY